MGTQKTEEGGREGGRRPFVFSVRPPLLPFTPTRRMESENLFPILFPPLSQTDTHTHTRPNSLSSSTCSPPSLSSALFLVPSFHSHIPSIYTSSISIPFFSFHPISLSFSSFERGKKRSRTRPHNTFKACLSPFLLGTDKLPLPRNVEAAQHSVTTF